MEDADPDGYGSLSLAYVRPLARSSGRTPSAFRHRRKRFNPEFRPKLGNCVRPDDRVRHRKPNHPHASPGYHPNVAEYKPVPIGTLPHSNQHLGVPDHADGSEGVRGNPPAHSSMNRKSNS